jgi:hypothetical protein
MAKETINEIVSQEAFTQLQKLSAELVLLNQQMNDNIANVDKFNRAMSGSASTKEAANNINNVNIASEKLNQTNSERLNLERKVSEAGKKMAEAVKEEVAEVNRLQLALTNASKDQREVSIRINELNEGIKKQKEQLKILNKEYGASSEKKGEIVEKIQQMQIELKKEKDMLKLITVELQSNEGSHQQLSAQLAILTKQYNEMDVQQRDTTEGGRILLEQMNRLNESLKGLEEAHGSHQRSVGEYEKGQVGATGKTEQLRTTLMKLKDALAGEMMALDTIKAKINEQTNATEQLLQTKGKESKEYQESVQALNELTKAQTKATEAIQTMQEETGKLQNYYGDAQKSVKGLSSDFANTDAAVQGVGVMIDAYTVLQSTMVGLGIESEGLMDIFAKLMILQQGINSVSQITKALQSDSILRTKIESALMVLKSGYQKRMLAAQIASNAATAAGNVATGASVGIFKKAKIAIQAMNAALASNPFILLAMAIIAAVAALIKFIGNQKAERVELLNKAIDKQNKILAKNKENLDKTVEVLRAWGVGEQQILDLKEAQIKADMAMAKSTMNRIRNDKDATAEQKNNATTAYNEQVKLWNDLQQEQKLFNIKKARDDAQAKVDAANKAKEEADAKIEQNKKAWEKRIEDERKYREKLTEEIKKLEYESKSEKEKLDADLLDAEYKKNEEIKKYPKQRADIEKRYTLEVNKLKEEYNENEKARLVELEDATIEHYEKLKTWAVEAYNKLSDNTRMQEENDLNDLIIQGVKDTEAEKLKIRQKYATEERKLFEDAKAVLIAGGMSQEEWTNKYKQLKAEEAIATANSNNFQIQSENKLKEERQAAAMEAVNGFAALGSAIAANIKDEKERMRVEAAIALVQALVNQGIAIAKVVAEDEGDPYTKAVRIIANVAAIAAAMVSATAAFRQAASAMPYAEGTDFHKGGDAIVGERYEPELVLMKNKPLIVDKPTFFKDMPIGTKVIPFSKMESGNNMLSMTETNDLLRAIKEKQTVSINVSDRVTSFINSKLGYTKILNSKFKA